MEFEIYHYVLFFVAAFFGGFIDAIAGGGGLICLPALLAAGIPPHAALATNKLQGVFGTFTAAANFAKKGFVNFSEIWIGIFWTFVGAVIGTTLVLFVNAKFLNYIIPVLLFAILIYTIFSPNLGVNEVKAKMSIKVFYTVFGVALGFYDGFFGPGTGSFWTFALIGLLGLGMKKAVAHTKVLNFVSNIVSLVVFFSRRTNFMGRRTLYGGRSNTWRIFRIKSGYQKRCKIYKSDISFCGIFDDFETCL